MSPITIFANRLSIVLRFSAVVATICLLVPAGALAQATRTWISGVGDDANPCSRTAPCKTFAGAIAKTAAGGEIDALDPGGFGALTITKAITLDGGGGQVASVLVSGTNGISVAAGATDAVIIRNLRFNGLYQPSSPGAAGLNGINFTSGASLRLQNVRIDGFLNNCINVNLSANAMVEILDTVVSNCGGGLAVASTGSAAVKASVERSRFILSHNNSGSSTIVTDNTNVNGYNGIGVAVTGTGAVVQMSNSTVFGNATGLSATNGGVINSFGNNQILGNTLTNGSFTGLVSSN